MKARITKRLVGQKKFDLVVVRNIVCMLAFGSSNGSNRGVAKVLGVNKRNIWKGMWRQMQLESMKSAF